MTVAELMQARGTSFEQLLAGSGLDQRVLEAIMAGRYTPSPQQRQRVASALGVEQAEISWSHTTPVSHLYGHGPQFGRTP